MREENDVYRYPQRGSNVVLKATGRIYYLQCVFVKQKSARKNDGNRTLHFFMNKKCMFKRAIHKLMTQAEEMGSMRKSPLNRYVSIKRHLSSSRKIQPKFFCFKTLSTSTILYHPQYFIIHYPLLCFLICMLTE